LVMDVKNVDHFCPPLTGDRSRDTAHAQ